MESVVARKRAIRLIAMPNSSMRQIASMPLHWRARDACIGRATWNVPHCLWGAQAARCHKTIECLALRTLQPCVYYFFILDTCEYVSWPMLRLNFGGRQ